MKIKSNRLSVRALSTTCSRSCSIETRISLPLRSFIKFKYFSILLKSAKGILTKMLSTESSSIISIRSLLLINFCDSIGSSRLTHKPKLSISFPSSSLFFLKKIRIMNKAIKLVKKTFKFEKNEIKTIFVFRFLFLSV